MLLGGTNVTGWAPERISRQGLGRSYQKTNIFLPLTVHENALAAQSRDAQQPWNPLRWWQDTRSDTIKNRATSARLESAIELSGLKDGARPSQEPQATASSAGRNCHDPGYRAAGAAA